MNGSIKHVLKFPAVFTALLLVLVCGPVAPGLDAAPAPWYTGQSNADDLVVKLVTIEPGDALYSWWGHSAIIIEDKKLKHSRFYNFGIFSFKEKNFFTNFAMGRLFFIVGALPTGMALENYRSENRGIRIQTLDLAPEKKIEMARNLEYNILPENRQYLYDHYFDNCATRVRDVINIATDGTLKRQTDTPSELTLRQLTRKYTHRSYPTDLLLMFLMGGSIDEPISVWDRMFLPIDLELNVAGLTIRDANGRERPLVSENVRWYDAVGRDPVPETATRGWPISLLIGLVLGLGGFMLSLFIAGERSRPIKQIRIVYGIYTGLLGLLFGVVGTALFFFSLFTDHAVTYFNENLFLANPITLLLFPFGVAAAAGSRKSLEIVRWIWVLHGFLTILLLFLKIFPLFSQQNWMTLSLVAPLYIGFSIERVWRVVGSKVAKPKA